MKTSFSYGLLGTFLFLPFSFSYFTPQLSSHFPRAPNYTIKQYLVPHNSIRSKVGLPPLKWSKKLASFSSWWASQSRRVFHSYSNLVDNLFWGSERNWKAGDAVAAWAQEKTTQMVWTESLKIVCARVGCRIGDTFTSNYDHHGN